MAHPQANSEAEVTNKTPTGSESPAGSSEGLRVDELYHVLWTYQTTQRIPTRETPFNLIFGIETVNPVKIGLPLFKVEY